MASTINTITTGAGGIVATGDSSGVLQFQSGGTTAITIDTSQNVGIGTASPASKLSVGSASYSQSPSIGQVNGTNVTTTNSGGLFNIGSTDAAAANIGGSLGFTANGTLNGYPTGQISGRRESATGSNYSSYLAFTTSDSGGTLAERMRIDSSGRVTTPYQPMFSGYRSATPTTVAATNAIIHNQVFVNVGSNYDTSNGRFTAPIAGYYEVIIFAHAENSTPINCGIYKNGSNIMSAYQGGAAYGRVGNTAILSLAAGDYIQHYVTYGTIWAGDISGASMSVKLIG